MSKYLNTIRKHCIDSPLQNFMWTHLSSFTLLFSVLGLASLDDDLWWLISAEVVDAMTAAIGARLRVLVVSGVSITTAWLEPSVINYNVNIAPGLYDNVNWNYEQNVIHTFAIRAYESFLRQCEYSIMII